MSDCECGIVFGQDAEMCAECAADEIERLRAEVAEKDKRIEELIKIVMEVSTKYPGETRAETALRYVRECENRPCVGPHRALDGEEVTR